MEGYYATCGMPFQCADYRGSNRIDVKDSFCAEVAGLFYGVYVRIDFSL